MRILFSFVFVAFFTASLFAQYPKDETINPYPKQVKEKKLVQRFDAAGWKALHDSQLTQTDKTVKIESSGFDPYVLLPNVQNPVAGAFEFRIRMKNGMKPGAEIFWGTSKRPGSHPDFSVRFNFLRDNDWHTYSANFETDEPLTQLRLDPGTSEGVAEIEWVELYQITYDDTVQKSTPSWYDPNWSAKVKNWKTISSNESKNIRVKFDEQGTGAQVFNGENFVGEIYPLAYSDGTLPLGGVASVPLYHDDTKTANQTSGPLALKFLKADAVSVEFTASQGGTLSFHLTGDELHFALKSETSCFGPVFRPKGKMLQALLSGVEYLEEGEHSSSTADIETAEHLRYAPKPLDVTIPLMAIVTENTAFGLLWNNPETQAVFATPDFIFGDPSAHHLGLHGTNFSGTVKIFVSGAAANFSPLDTLILWGVQKHGLPDLPKRFRNDEEQRVLNLAAYEKSTGFDPQSGWRHASMPGTKQTFPATFGVDYITAIWQLTGKLPETPPNWVHGGAHLRNPAAFLLAGKAERLRDHCRSEGKGIAKQQRADGAYPYSGEFLKGHWEDTASGHSGNALFRLLYDYRIVGDKELLDAAIKGLEFANKYSVPRGAQVWELSLHTPDIMGSSRMCMANVWAFEATGNQNYLAHAKRWAITGLPFVYLWQSDSIKSRADGAPGTTVPIMKYATTPVLGATHWRAPNWIGLPVQWCGLDYSEALFMLAEHDKTLDWRKIAEGILITAEQMQYPDGSSVGLLPDSFTLETQQRNPSDINPTVLVIQRRRLQGKLPTIDVAVSKDGKFRVVSPFKTKIDGNVAEIEAIAGTTYQIIVNGNEIKTITSQGVDRVPL